MNPSPIEELKKFIAPVHTLQEEEWNAFASIWQPFSAKRKELLTAAGETEKYLYFVTAGLLPRRG